LYASRIAQIKRNLDRISLETGRGPLDVVPNILNIKVDGDDDVVPERVEFALQVIPVDVKLDGNGDLVDLVGQLTPQVSEVDVGDDSDNRTETCATGLPPGEVIGSRSPHLRR
jgi:hypothetical protein